VQNVQKLVILHHDRQKGVFYFSKAFDRVSHNILLGKLRKYGLDEW